MLLHHSTGRDLAKECVRLFHVLEKRLGETPFLAGDYSIADIGAFTWTNAVLAKLREDAADKLGDTPSIDRWLTGDWIDWLEVAGLSHLTGRPRRVFDHFFVTRQAVEDALGIGVGPLPLLDTDIAFGRIMLPLPEIRVQRTGYVALTSVDAQKDELLGALVAWLVTEGQHKS